MSEPALAYEPALDRHPLAAALATLPKAKQADPSTLPFCDPGTAERLSYEEFLAKYVP